MLGLCARAGKAKSGEFAAEKAVKEGKAFLVILAKDSSFNTKKKFKDICSFRGIPVKEYSSKEELGRSIGKEYRSMVAVTDKGLSEAIIRKMKEVDM